MKHRRISLKMLMEKTQITHLNCHQRTIRNLRNHRKMIQNLKNKKTNRKSLQIKLKNMPKSHSQRNNLLKNQRKKMILLIKMKSHQRVITKPEIKIAMLKTKIKTPKPKIQTKILHKRTIKVKSQNIWLKLKLNLNLSPPLNLKLKASQKLRQKLSKNQKKLIKRMNGRRDLMLNYSKVKLEGSLVTCKTLKRSNQLTMKT